MRTDPASRGTSTKTRIETEKKMEAALQRYDLREAHPLKQGLKLAKLQAGAAGSTLREAHPLKQGLKPTKAYNEGLVPILREAHPLKQGLKLARLYLLYHEILFERHIH